MNLLLSTATGKSPVWETRSDSANTSHCIRQLDAEFDFYGVLVSLQTVDRGRICLAALFAWDSHALNTIALACLSCGRCTCVNISVFYTFMLSCRRRFLCGAQWTYLISPGPTVLSTNVCTTSQGQGQLMTNSTAFRAWKTTMHDSRFFRVVTADTHTLFAGCIVVVKLTVALW